MKALKWLDAHFEETLLILLLVMISSVELVQVIFRNLPFVPALTWAEEFCRFAWIWSVFFSLPYTIRKGSMLRVTVLLDALPERVRGGLNIAVDLITSAAMLLLGVHSVSVVRSILVSGETSPAMRWPMWIVYSVMLIGFFGGFLRGLQQVYLHIRRLRDRRGDDGERTDTDTGAVRRGEGGDV